MKAAVLITSAEAISETTLRVSFQVSASNRSRLSLDAEVPISPSANQVNSAIRNRVVAAATEFGGTGIQSGDITVFGGVA